MPISQHRMALAPFFVAVIAVLFISGSSIYAGVRPAPVHAASSSMVTADTSRAVEMGPIEPNNTIVGPQLPPSTPAPLSKSVDAQAIQGKSLSR